MKKFCFFTIICLPWLLQAAELHQLTVDNGKSKNVIEAEVVKTETERAKGLMGMTHLADNQGMLFVFAQPTQSPFWMKNTPLPLSIGFLDESGKLVQTLDMDPCPQEPCPLYMPDAPYRYALELPQGWFKVHDVHPGTAITLPGL
jgi:uncharacterized membrane protein (UPF0127 family)